MRVGERREEELLVLYFFFLPAYIYVFFFLKKDHFGIQAFLGQSFRSRISTTPSTKRYRAQRSCFFFLQLYIREEGSAFLPGHFYLFSVVCSEFFLFSFFRSPQFSPSVWVAGENINEERSVGEGNLCIGLVASVEGNLQPIEDALPSTCSPV